MPAHIARAAEQIGRTDRLMGFLGVLGLGGVEARLLRQIAIAIVGGNQPPAGRNGLARELHRIRTHISDETDGIPIQIHAFIQALGHPHGMAGAEAQFARGLLLQGGGGEGGEGVALDRLALDRRNLEGRPGVDLRRRSGGRGLVG